MSERVAKRQQMDSVCPRSGKAKDEWGTSKRNETMEYLHEQHSQIQIQIQGLRIRREWVTMGGRWIVLPQKDNELVVDEESQIQIQIQGF